MNTRTQRATRGEPAQLEAPSVGRDWVGVLQVHDVPRAFSFIGVINLEHRAEGHRPHTPTNERSNNKSLKLCKKFEQEVHQETQNMSLSPYSSHQHVK